MNLKKVLVILLLILYFNTISIAGEDKLFPLKDNSSISLSKILSVQTNIISEYNKDFERYPPENKQLYHLFILNQSFKSTILLSYWGSIGFFFEESNISETKFRYLGEDQYGTFVSGIPFSKGVYIKNGTIWNINGNNNYGLETDISTLDIDYLKQLALEYYLHDYAQYIAKNAQLKQIEEESRQKLDKSLEELNKIYQSGDELEKAKATLQFYQLANELGYPDASAKKILNDLNSQNLTQQQSSILWSYTIVTAVCFMVMGLAFVRFERWKNKLTIEGKIGSVAYITHIFEGLITLVGFGLFNSLSPEADFSQYVVVLIAMVVGITLTLKYEKP